MNVNTGKKRILLHICCAPCSTHPLQLLSTDYDVTGFFFNPNLFPPSEHNFRLEETRRYFAEKGMPLIAPDLNRSAWLDLVRAFSDEPEGSQRCRRCFEFRLEKTARLALEMGIFIFSSTLTIGPNKPAAVIFPLGHELAKRYDLKFLAIDFKKKDGYKNSVKLSKEAGMYRQNYCGCEFSQRDRNIRESRRFSCR